MRRHRDHQVEIAACAGGAAAFAGHAHPLPRPHAGGDLHLELAHGALPAAAPARGARLAAHVTGAVARRAWLVDLHREALARSLERLLERDLDVRLDVFPRDPAAAVPATEQVLDARSPPRLSPSRACVAEDRPEEIREIAEVTGTAAVLDAEAARRSRPAPRL